MTVVRNLRPLPVAERIAWATAQVQAALQSPYGRFASARSAENDARLLAELDKPQLPGLWFLEQLTDEAALEAFNSRPPRAWAYVGVDDLRRALARFELRALPGILAFAATDRGRAAEALFDVCSPRVAPLMAEVLLELKKGRAFAERWLLAFADEASLCLVPVAVGELGKPRDAAGHALRFLATNGKQAVVRAAAERYGGDVAAVTAQVLAVPSVPGPRRLPRLPAFWEPLTFPRPLLADRTSVLPLAALENLGLRLALSTLEAPHPDLAAIKEACDPRSLAAFVWALFEAWLIEGAPSREGWALHALAHFGDDDVARDLTPLVREWPSEGGFARAVTGLDVLARIGTDIALMHLDGIARKVGSRPLQERARARIGAIAASRGLSAAGLADRLVPDLGLDATGSRTLDFGPRSFRVGFDEQLRPFVRNASGERLCDLPKPSRADDPAKAEQASGVWKALKKDARSVSSLQLARLETAMSTRRRWRTSEFHSLLAGHPLLKHIVGRLVWGVFDASCLVASFRVAEDGSFASVEDTPFELPAAVEVGIPHRLELPEPSVEAWAQLLADYQVLQPFPQLGRPVFRIGADERDALALSRVAGLKVHAGRVLGLERRGWSRGEVGDGGVVSTMLKPLPHLDDSVAELELDPGLWTRMIADTPEQTLGSVRVRTPGTWGDRGCRRLGSLDAVTLSELVADVESLRA